MPTIYYTNFKKCDERVHTSQSYLAVTFTLGSHSLFRMNHSRRSFAPYLSGILIASVFFFLGLTVRIPSPVDSRANLGLQHAGPAGHSKRAPGAPPKIGHMLETCLYIRRMDVAVKFYKDILGLENFMVTVCRLCGPFPVSKD